MVARTAASTIVLLVLLLAPSVQAGIADHEEAQRISKAEPQDLFGNLTWRQGTGGISWADEPESNDYVANPVSGRTKGLAAWIDRYYDTPESDMPPPLTFTSEPLPYDLHLNVSRQIEIILFLRNPGPTTGSYYQCGTYGYNSRTGYELTLTSEGTFLGGVVNGQQSRGATRGASSDPSLKSHGGFSPCRFIIHPEVSYLAAGTKLVLNILRTESNHCYVNGVIQSYEPAPCSEFDLGMSEQHRSYIRFSLYNELDRFLRDANPPDPPAAPSGGDDGKESDAAAPIMGLLALAALAHPRRKTLLIVLALGSAGCLSEPTPVSQTQATNDQLQTSQEPSGNLSAAPGKASIVGEVMDEFRRPVSDANVAILGRANFTTTDPLGRFAIPAIEPGDVRLRVDRDGYVPVESRLSLRAGEVTRVRLELKALLPEESAFRPHHHDFWLGATTIQLFKGDVDGAYFELPQSDRDRKIIVPGTYEVEVKVSWPTAYQATRIGVQFRDGADPNDLTWGNLTQMYPREKAKPFRIAANWDMTDNGHAPSSVWSFRLFRMEYDGPRAPAAYLETPPGTFEVSITLHKGLVPLEPAHPDHWKDLTSFTVIDSVKRYGNHSVRDYPLRPDLVVPHDTKYIEVTVTQHPSSHPLTFTLHYKGGNKAIDAACLSAIANGQGQNIASQRCTHQVRPADDPVETDGTTTRWRITLLTGEGDEIYSERSRVVLDLIPVPDGKDAQRTPAGTIGYVPASWTVDAIVSRA